MELFLALTLFFLILIILQVSYSLIVRRDSRSIQMMVEKYSTPQEVRRDALNHNNLSNIKLFNEILLAIPPVKKLAELMQQGGVKILAGVFILSSLLFSAVAFLVSFFLLKNHIAVSVTAAAVALLLPFLWLLSKRRQRRINFEEHFPDALDLMGYAMKAGHSIMASLKMVSEEMPAPINEEFAIVVEEINFGKSIDSTLRNFAKRVDSTELRYFVTSVIVQRETGGNLVEILEKISAIIRKKFRFRERVRALSAEGKLSAIILVALPFCIALAVSVLNKEYVAILITDPIGPYLITGAVIMMSFGSFIIYKFVQLDM
ncbi:type II secretion system F family protein [Desulfotalea psychrophila]|uniref:Related to TadB n=1 Tax=Desulfotalea psychrophila (strain LSv54 / DSM 12343) TaxID=177439 RepID=Q6AN16_DESPS|nr:type II secretion system F family protein [Desulfotalea psychrophila]CAG36258.1 related to TadB [Desulfotalea psychrophila LSv54]